MTSVPLAGGCLCGGVRFELDAAPQVAGCCHCTHGQGRTGSAASAQALVDADPFRIVHGEELVRDGGRASELPRIRRRRRAVGAGFRRGLERFEEARG